MPVRAEAVVAFRQLVLELQGVGEGGLAVAVLGLDGFDGCLEPGQVLLPDFDRPPGQGRAEQFCRDVPAQLLQTITGIGQAQGSLGFGGKPVEFWKAPQREFLFNAIGKIANLGRVHTARVEGAAAQHQGWILPGANTFRVEFGGADTGIGRFQGWVIGPRRGHEGVDVLAGDRDGAGRVGRPGIEQGADREQDDGGILHDGNSLV